MKYHLARGEEQLGTFNDLDVSAGLREKRFLPTDLCWAEGMKEWQALGLHLQELATAAGVEAAVEAPAIAALREEVRQDLVREQELASLWQRLGARLIDWLMLSIPSVVIYSTLMDTAGFDAEIRTLQNDPAAMMAAMQRHFEHLQSQIVKALETGNPTVLAMYLVIILLILSNIVLLTIRGQSIGKLLTGIQIVRSPDGSKAGFVRTVLLRWFLFAVINTIQFIGPALMLGDALMIFRKDRRCLHDLVADTMVTKKNG